MQQTHRFSLGTNAVYGAVIFDFDGVILDTERYHLAAWNAAAARFSLSFSEEEYLPLKSTGRPYIASVLEKKAGRKFSESERRTLFEEKQAYFEEGIKSLGEGDLIAGAVDFLRFLQRENIPAAVASSGTLCTVLAKRFGLDGYFSFILGPRDDLAKKPAPDCFLAAAKRLGFAPADCLVAEDSEAGLAAAHAAGMDAIAIGKARGDCVLRTPDFTKVLPLFCRK